MARGHVRVRTYVDTDSRAARTDGRTERQTDGQQICNALTPVLNEMRYGGRETVSGWSAGRGDDGPQGSAGNGGVWRVVGRRGEFPPYQSYY